MKDLSRRGFADLGKLQLVTHCNVGLFSRTSRQIDDILDLFVEHADAPRLEVVVDPDHDVFLLT
ncbi:MAG: hypothetical protein ACYC6L_13440 [Anaerolineae bacterium]